MFTTIWIILSCLPGPNGAQACSSINVGSTVTAYADEASCKSAISAMAAIPDRLLVCRPTRLFPPAAH